MKCPFCKAEDTQVIDSRVIRDGVSIRRRRTCSVCEKDMFLKSVSILTDELKAEVQKISSELFLQVFDKMHHIEIVHKAPVSDGSTSCKMTNHCYICMTCKTEIKKGKLPTMARANGLELVEIDKELHLSELENNLIARKLLFQKIYQLPKSRMAACKDRLVNIPIQAADIESTLSNIPRTPREAGLLEVKLKRKLGYKNTHQHSYIDPEKIYKALDLLKSTGHPDYCFYDDYNAYKNRVNSSSLIKFVDDYNIDEIVEKDVYELCVEKEKKKQE